MGLSPTDLYYLSVSSNIFLYGYLIVMIVGFIGNACQMVTFARRTLRTVSTGVFFLALSISDTLYLLKSVHVLVVYGFNLPNRSDQVITCKLRYFVNYFTTNFSAWMLAMVSGDRWLRSQFPMASKRFCTPRRAIYGVLAAIVIDVLLHSHILTPLFGYEQLGVTGICGASYRYPWYVRFFEQHWPIVTILTVTVLPACSMMLCLAGITINTRRQRNRIQPVSSTIQHQRRSHFLDRQMFILMLANLTLFFITTLPNSLFRFAISTLRVKQPFAINLLLTAIFSLIDTLNYSLNFYLHCLTSKLFRKEFLRWSLRLIRVQLHDESLHRAANDITPQRHQRPMKF